MEHDLHQTRQQPRYVLLAVHNNSEFILMHIRIVVAKMWGENEKRTPRLHQAGMCALSFTLFVNGNNMINIQKFCALLIDIPTRNEIESKFIYFIFSEVASAPE